MSCVIVDNRTPKKCLERLVSLGFSVITLPSFPSLQEPVSAHPDMLLFFAGENVFCHEDYLEMAKAELRAIADMGYDINTSNERISSRYPEDILFNAARIGDRIYCKADRISNLIKEYAAENKLRIRNVNQGYAKCSVCVVSENAAITADAGLCRAMREDGIDVLLISQGHVALAGYDTGFIGGCSGSDGKRVYFSGNIELHPDGNVIADFCRSHGKEPISLSDEPLYDIGTMFFI